MLDPPQALTAVELRDRLRGGNSRPWLVVALDAQGNETKVVLKLTHPGPPVGQGHYGATSLACELVSSALARAVGLNVPTYAVVEVTEAFARCTPPGEPRETFLRNVGHHFGCEFHPGLASWRPDSDVSSTSLLDTIGDVLAFDATVINGDRKREKPNLLYRGDLVFPIDHSLALPMHLWDDATIDESPLFPDEQIRAHCVARQLTGAGRPLSRVFDAWRANVDGEFLQRLRQVLPAAWERQRGDIDRVFRFVERRSTRFDDIAESLTRVLT